MRLLRWSLVGYVLWRLLGPPARPRFRGTQEHPWRVHGRTVFIGDEEFLIRETGPEAGEPLLLIHGLGGSSLGEWYLVGPKLAASHRLILIDHRSHGMSRDFLSRYEIEDLADDLAGVLDEMGVESVTAVGYSMGGAVAQSLAHQHPGKVSRLVLIATFATHTTWHRLGRRLGAVVARAWERLTGTGTPEVRSGYLLGTGAVERRHARWLWEETHRRNPDAGAQATLSLLRFDSSDWVGTLSQRALVIIPTMDFLVPPPWQHQLAELLTAATVVEIPARHEVVWTHPERIAEEIESFLAQSP